MPVIAVIVFKDTGPNGEFGHSIAYRDDNDQQEVYAWTRELEHAQILADSMAVAEGVAPAMTVPDYLSEDAKKNYVAGVTKSGRLYCPYCGSSLVGEVDEETGDPYCRILECDSCNHTWTEIFHLVDIE